MRESARPATTASAPISEVGIVGGLANTANQVGAAIALAAFTTAVAARTASQQHDTVASLAAGYSLVFLIGDDAGIALGIRALTLLLPARDNRAHESTGAR